MKGQPGKSPKRDLIKATPTKATKQDIKHAYEELAVFLLGRYQNKRAKNN